MRSSVKKPALWYVKAFDSDLHSSTKNFSRQWRHLTCTQLRLRVESSWFANSLPQLLQSVLPGLNQVASKPGPVQSIKCSLRPCLWVISKSQWWYIACSIKKSSFFPISKWDCVSSCIGLRGPCPGQLVCPNGRRATRIIESTEFKPDRASNVAPGKYLWEKGLCHKPVKTA